jgi:hypothetical protein
VNPHRHEVECTLALEKEQKAPYLWHEPKFESAINREGDLKIVRG